jgi:hypothetical protein
MQDDSLCSTFLFVRHCRCAVVIKNTVHELMEGDGSAVYVCNTILFECQRCAMRGWILTAAQGVDGAEVLAINASVQVVRYTRTHDRGLSTRT